MWGGDALDNEDDTSFFDETIHPLLPSVDASSHRTLPTPTFSAVSNYIRALCQSARMGAEASVVALAYVERVVSSGALQLDGNTWRRCTLAAWILASKMWDDDTLENRDFAALFGYAAEDINALEGRFVAAIGFRLALSSAEYARYYFALRSICQTSSDSFPLRPLDGELEAQLKRREAAVNGCALGAWSAALERCDLSASV